MKSQIKNASEARFINQLRKLSIQDKHREALNKLEVYIKKRKNISTELKLQKAFLLYHLGKNRQAINIYKKILQGNKNFLNALIFLSRTYSILKERDSATIAKTAYLIIPNLVTLNNLANIFDILGEYKQAEEWYMKALKSTKTKEDELIIKSNLALLTAKHNPKKAKKYINKLLDDKILKRGKFKSLSAILNRTLKKL